MGVDAQIRFRADLTDDQLSDLRYRLHDALEGVVYVYRPEGRKTGPIKTHCIVPANDDCGDPEPGWWRVSLWPRYYGPLYERGPWESIAGLMEWLSRQQIIDRVEYRGDGGDPSAWLDWRDIREPYWDHFAKHGHLPRLARHGHAGPACPDCGGMTWHSGSAYGVPMYSCPGCNWTSWESTPKA